MKTPHPESKGGRAKAHTPNQKGNVLSPEEEEELLPVFFSDMEWGRFREKPQRCDPQPKAALHLPSWLKSGPPELLPVFFSDMEWGRFREKPTRCDPLSIQYGSYTTGDQIFALAFDCF